METQGISSEIQTRLALLSHEFKAPLGVTLNSIQLIQEKMKQQCA